MFQMEFTKDKMKGTIFVLKKTYKKLEKLN